MIKNWKSAAGREREKKGAGSHHEQTRVAASQEPVPERRKATDNRAFKATSGSFFFLNFCRGSPKGGEYKATCGQIHRVLDALRRKRDYSEAGSCCGDCSAVVHGLSGEYNSRTGASKPASNDCLVESDHHTSQVCEYQHQHRFLLCGGGEKTLPSSAAG